MAVRKKGIGFLVAGVVALLAAMALGLSGFLPMFSQFKQLVVLESHGQAQFTAESAGTYTLWHDYSTTFKGRRIVHPQKLPSGFGTTMIRIEDGATFEMKPVRVTETVNLGDRNSMAVGRFELDKPGNYMVGVHFPAGEKRVFSMTEGTMLGSMGQFGIRFGLAMLAGAIGFVLVILGIVFMVVKPKPKRGSLPPPV